jgi:hypothetical protein
MMGLGGGWRHGFSEADRVTPEENVEWIKRKLRDALDEAELYINLLAQQDDATTRDVSDE